MATIGQPLTAPEAGWRRYDDVDSRIIYIGKWNAVSKTGTGTWKNTYHGVDTSVAQEASIKFNFMGTKIRIMGTLSTDRANQIKVFVDNTLMTTFSEMSSSYSAQVLFVDIQNLIYKKHTIQITIDSNNGYYGMVFDSIDIDDTGYLVIPTPSNLTAIAGDSQVSLSWDAVLGATGYNVKRSTASGGPYTTIAGGVTGTSYVDTDVKNGTTYYYVVTAVDAESESDNSNEASATPVAPDGYGLLRVTMIDSSEREYKLPMSEITEFISWFDRTVGTGTTVYALNKLTPNSKEYLSFEKIISFEVTTL